jgi:hypothetical protein
VAISRPEPPTAIFIPDRVESSVKEIPIEIMAPAGLPPIKIPPPWIPPDIVDRIVPMWSVNPVAVIPIIIIDPIFVVPVISITVVIVIIDKICCRAKEWYGDNY